ncbi:MAG: carboxylesterase family protein [bacterium]|nr:carboxylesterase family protein [bacterium]
MRRGPLLALGLAALLACGRGAPPISVDPTSQRTPPAGPVVGFTGRYGSHAWRGLPYAEPPTGARRWRAPAPAAPWRDVREALAPGVACVQYASIFGGVTGGAGEVVGDEDCLTLDVWAPRVASEAIAGARWPVMVWIHGGGNTIGTTRFYDGGHLAQTQQVVVVAIQYRLGPMGWFRHPAVQSPDASPEDRSGNFGTLDMIRALEWVRDNVAAFGGDPSNVTIFGESAGATDVFGLLVAPPARGLFHRAIAQSGGLHFATIDAAEGRQAAPSPGPANGSADALARLLVAEHEAADPAAARALVDAAAPGALGAAMRALPAASIMRAYPPGEGGSGLIQMPLVIREGTVIPTEEPLDLLARAGGHAAVPVMVGTNRDEMKLFMANDPARVWKLFGLFPRIRDPRWYDLSAEYHSRMWKATGADEPAARLAAAGTPVWVYRFDWDEEPTVFGTDLSQLLGAAHGFEIPFVFGHWDLGRAANAVFDDDNLGGRNVLGAQMASYWTQLAVGGDPGQGRDGSATAWTRWDPAPGAPRCLVLDTPAGGGLRMVSEEVTRTAVLDAVARDPRLATPRDRCRIHHELVVWGRGTDRDDYAVRCPDFPFDGYPWE